VNVTPLLSFYIVFINTQVFKIAYQNRKFTQIAINSERIIHTVYKKIDINLTERILHSRFLSYFSKISMDLMKYILASNLIIYQ